MYCPTRSILLVTFDVRRRGGIERLSLHVATSLRRAGHRVKVIYPSAWFPGSVGRWLGRASFALKLAAAVPFADAVVSMHALLLEPLHVIRRAIQLIGARRSQRLHCWMHGIEVWGAALDPVQSGLERCDSLIASSAFTRDRVLETPGRWPPTVVIHPMADLVGEAEPPSEMPSVPRLITIARLDIGWGYKGHRLVIAALAGLRRQGILPAGFRWDVIGDGNDRTNLEAEASALGIADLCIFHGDLPDADLRCLLRASSAMVMPSPYSPGSGGRASGEGFGIVYLEAALAGRASIACRSGGQADLIEDGVNGVLVEPDVESIASALRRLLSDPSAFGRLGAAARARALAEFGIARFDERIKAMVATTAAGVRAAGPRDVAAVPPRD